MCLYGKKAKHVIVFIEIYVFIREKGERCDCKFRYICVYTCIGDTCVYTYRYTYIHTGERRTMLLYIYIYQCLYMYSRYLCLYICTLYI